MRVLHVHFWITHVAVLCNLSACDFARKIDVTESPNISSKSQGARPISEEEAAPSDAMLTGFATVVGAANLAPLLAVSLVPNQPTITLAVENTRPLMLENDSVKLALTMIESARGGVNLNALPIEDGGNVKINGLTTGERVKILVRVITLTIERAQIAKDVVKEVRQNNVAPERIKVVAQARVSAAFAKIPEKNESVIINSPDRPVATTPQTDPQSPRANDTNAESQPPASNTTTTESQPPHSILYQASGFYLSGIASNSVQSASHPFVIEAAAEILDAVNSVQCSWTWGPDSQTSNTLDSCSYSREQGKILVNLPHTVEQNKSGFGQIRVRLLTSSGDTSGIKILKLYLTPSVAGLLPCAPPTILASSETLLGSPALATMAGQAFDNASLSTNIRINVNLADNTKVLEKFSLRTSYKKITYRDNDYIVIYKAWPAFTAQQFGSAISHDDMCRMAEEYKPMTKIKNKLGNTGRKLARFDAMVISSSGVLVGINETGQTRRIADAHKTGLTYVIGAGAEKQVSENCDALLPAGDRYRATVLCVKIQE